jgi:hypothetical protein
MAGAGQAGEVLLDLNLPYASALLLPSPSLSLVLQAPANPSLLGAVLFAQGLIVDVAPTATVPFGLSNGLRLQFGS